MTYGDFTYGGAGVRYGGQTAGGTAYLGAGAVSRDTQNGGVVASGSRMPGGVIR